MIKYIILLFLTIILIKIILTYKCHECVLESYDSSCSFSGEKGLMHGSLVQYSNSKDNISLKSPKLPYQDKGMLV